MIRIAIIVALGGALWYMVDRTRRERVALAAANAIVLRDSARVMIGGVIEKSLVPSDSVMRRVNGPGVDSFVLAGNMAPATTPPKDFKTSPKWGLGVG